MHTTHSTIGTTISPDALCPQLIQPSYSAALVIVPSMIEFSATIEMGRPTPQGPPSGRFGIGSVRPRLLP